ncbi:pyridoxal-phosphate dependent enzyme [Pseudonocardia acaciae]|uniref:pyridoxal-phosphate dependent enzyme n=1 Tax=Pseudonocardia acaciae TaxID=551276 RepID=UPI00048C81CC|nr:pyridoxal-phosphate dependent enzyme [Pseudonocardia acaciae]
MTSLPGLDDILTARARLAGRTRLVALERAGADVWWACEYRQPTGSFKIRGATNAVLAAAHRGATAVTTASTGNHARAVTHVARAEGLGVTAFVSRGVAASRVRALERAGARVDRRAADQAEAIARAEAAAVERGQVFVPPFDDPEVIAGQGTLGLELGEALPDLDVVVVPVSGGGLAAGVGLALRGRYPGVRLVGVGAERAPAMARSLAAGRPVAVAEESTVATSLMGDLGADNRFSFAVCREVIDELVLVSDDDLLAATGALHAAGHRVEPAAAAGAALLPRVTGRRVAVVLTGRADAPDEGKEP